MDRNLIAPAPDHHWHVSRVLDPRRSTGEAELLPYPENRCSSLKIKLSTRMWMG